MGRSCQRKKKHIKILRWSRSTGTWGSVCGRTPTQRLQNQSRNQARRRRRQRWYKHDILFPIINWIINEDIGHRNDDDDVETNSKNQGIWGAEATTITTIDPETKTSKKCKESNWSFFLLSGIFAASMMLDWIWSLKDVKYHDEYIFLEGGADHVHLHGVGDKDDLKQGAWRPHPCWQL